jgi:aspartyl-tRNA(Asn)/glutamyl-tRNA(Gln) amidotransferase subunit A
VAVKDNCDLAGHPTTGACGAFRNAVAERDATCISRLKDAGAIVLGKTNMHELAYGGTGALSDFGPARNPWNREHIAGGSSSGSGAAVAAGCVPAALGSDTGGSIRIPAAACGVTGLKPTFGRVSKAGVMPLGWSLDHVGPITRTACDAAILLKVLASGDARDPTTVASPFTDTAKPMDPGILRVAEVAGFPLDPAVARALDAAAVTLADLGYKIEPIRLEASDHAHVAWQAIMFAEAASAYAGDLAAAFDGFTPDVRVQLEAGQHISARTYLDAQRFRVAYGDIFNQKIAGAQAILMPSLPVPAPRLGQDHVDLPGKRVTTQDAMTFTNLTANMLGWPAISVPCGFSDAGLPVGLSVLGRPFDEATVLAVAKAYQAHTDWVRAPSV